MSHHLVLVPSRAQPAAPARWLDLCHRLSHAVALALHPAVQRRGRSVAARRAHLSYVGIALTVALFGGMAFDSPAASAGETEPPASDWQAPFAGWWESNVADAPWVPPYVAAEAAAEAPEPEPIVQPATRLPLPSGKGMWIWLPEKAEGGDPHAIVAKAKNVGLSHIYVRTGSSKSGFHGAAFLDQILPAAHDVGLRVYGWDFPYLWDAGVDAGRAMEAINYEAPGGHRIDGFVADIETPSEGTHLTVEGVTVYGHLLREAAGGDYPLLVAVPRPSDAMIGRYPYAEVIAPFSAVAPMVYWLNRQPDTDVVGAVQWLSQFGKPIIPVGQAYDGAPEGGRPGVPPPDEIFRFMRGAEDAGASGVSFWSWQHADEAAWGAIRDAWEFQVGPAQPQDMRPGDIRSVQFTLSELGYPASVTGAWDDATADALGSYQRDANLPETGHVDEATRALMLGPVTLP